jgi:hypothetical protein
VTVPRQNFTFPHGSYLAMMDQGSWTGAAILVLRESHKVDLCGSLKLSGFSPDNSR